MIHKIRHGLLGVSVRPTTSQMSRLNRRVVLESGGGGEGGGGRGGGGGILVTCAGLASQKSRSSACVCVCEFMCLCPRC